MFALPLPDHADAVDTALRLNTRPGLVWLDGGAGQGQEGRWSFVGSDPIEQIRVAFGHPEPLGVLQRFTPEKDTPSQVKGAPIPERVPRWAGYLAYDAFWSGRKRASCSNSPVPVVWFGRYDALMAFDHLGGKAFVVGDDRIACERMLARLDPAPARPQARVGVMQHEDPAIHARSIRDALELIAAGEIYQVNLARSWSAPYQGCPLALWLLMRQFSPVPLGFFLDADDHVVLCRTMERFLLWQGPGRALVTRPIKGTIKRSGSRDAAEAQELRTDEKEMAEHAMIVDLMRNDLGRVAQVGSVRVDGIMEVEPYAVLSHLVSTVSCLTRPDVSLHEVMQATFPPGSVTGTPKLRAIEIIEELERVPREIYTGAVGHVDRTGGASFAVAIRTAVIRAGAVRYLAGGGLVAASVVEKEIAETELKARVFLDAVQALMRSDEKGLPVPAEPNALRSAPYSGVVQG